MLYHTRTTGLSSSGSSSINFLSSLEIPKQELTFASRITNHQDFILPTISPKIYEIRIPLPVTEIQDPVKIEKSYEDKTPEKSVELPTVGNVIEKHGSSHPMIVIRRKKMKKHKRKKMRKRNKAMFLRIKTRRELAKEKTFQNEIFAQIEAANKFDPKEYVAEKLRQLDREILPLCYEGERVPESMIRELYAKDEQLRKEREERRRRKLFL